MKRLLVMRHAKSDWSGGVTDHDRPLSRRGTKAATSMGRVLSRMGQVPDHVISSSAVRAHTTVLLAADAGEWDTTITTTRHLYGTSIETALAVAAAAPRATERLMLVGHEPAWGALVAHLSGAAVQVKTATVVALDCFASEWPDLPAARAEIAFVLQPRLFTDGEWDGVA